MLDEIVDRLGEHGAELRGPEEHPGGDRSVYVEGTAAFSAD